MPRVAILPLGDVPDVVGGAEVMVAGVFLKVYGKAPGSILFLLPYESAFYLVDMLMGRKHGETKTLTPMDESALKEIGNILAGSYLNALCHFTRMTLLPSIPALAVDMAGALLSVMLIQLGQVGDHALVIETEFSTESSGVKGTLFSCTGSGLVRKRFSQQLGVRKLMAELIKVGMADYKVGSNPDALISYGLGSCVGIALFDPVSKVGGLSHIMLPDSSSAPFS